MSGNDSAESDYPMFEAWVNSTFIKKSDFEKYMAEFSQELTDKIMKEVSRTETTEVFVSETGGQGTVSEGVRTHWFPDQLLWRLNPVYTFYRCSCVHRLLDRLWLRLWRSLVLTRLLCLILPWNLQVCIILKVLLSGVYGEEFFS